MGAIVQLKTQYSYIYDELNAIGLKETIAIELIESFLDLNDMYSLNDVDTETATEYYISVNKNHSLTANQRRHFASSLESAIRLHCGDYTELESLELDRAIKNKLTFFLRINKIETIKDITPALRLAYEEYLTRTETKKAYSYLKAMDIAKLSSIQEESQTFMPRSYRYDNSVFYLTYHPNYEIAKRFIYTANKAPLFFDFSKNTSETIKRQIFGLLKHLVEEKKDVTTHMLLQNYITPLWDLYNFCVANSIEDILKIQRNDIDRFHQYQTSLTSKPTTSAVAIIGTLRKYTFLKQPSIDWDATAWYMERFQLNDGRMNPARPIEAFYFDDIQNSENLYFFKQYMKYLIGLSGRLSITSIYSSYQSTKQFLSFLEHENIDIKAINNAEIEHYISSLYLNNNRSCTTNKYINQLQKFLNYLQTKGYINSVEFYFEKYRATEVHTHNDISVSKTDQQKIFDVLDRFPEHLRLMFLNLWCIGLRINEVCTIKGNAYLYDGENAWFLIYQNKAKREKRVPIPLELYDIMTDYIKKNGINPTDYIFKAPKTTGAYRAGTFVKQVNALLTKYGLSEEYHFKSHGYRHTLATELYNNGLKVQYIREYLGHANEDMTKQYIDHLYNDIDRQNEEYFKSKNKEDYRW